MDQPEEADRTEQPRGRRGYLSWVVLVLAIPLLYFASAGPVAYLFARTYGDAGPPQGLVDTFSMIYYPARVVWLIYPPYLNFVMACRMAGIKQCHAEQEEN